MIDDFLSMASEKLGATASNTKQATSGLLGLVKEHADKADFSALADKIPGLGALADSTDGAEDGGGGIGGMLGNVLGGGASNITQLLGSGFDISKIGDLVGMLKEWLMNKVGGDLVGNIFKKLPDLGSLLGK